MVEPVIVGVGEFVSFEVFWFVWEVFLISSGFFGPVLSFSLILSIELSNGTPRASLSAGLVI